MKTQISKLLIAVLLVTVTVISCAPQPAPQPAAPQNLFAPLPPPAMPSNLAIASTFEFGDYTETSMNGELFQLEFKETGGGNVGESEVQKLNTVDQFRISNTFIFGTLDGAEYSTGYYGNEAVVRMKVSANIFSIFTPARGFLVDSSSLYLIYRKSTEGLYTLHRIEYQELWLGNEVDALAMGAFAQWNTNQSYQVMPEKYHNWGFWQDGATAKEQSLMVTDALTSAKNGLLSVAPDYLAADLDSVRELIGKQTGMQLSRNGQPWGTITMSYDNWLSGIGGTKGLSLVEFTFDNHICDLIVLKSGISPVDSWLYIMVCDNTTTVDAILKTQPENWPGMYKMLASDTMPGVITAIHVAGQPKDINVDFQYEDSSGDSSSTKTTSARVGRAGGRIYSMMYPYSYERVALTTQIMALLGKGGITSLNLSFPTIGSGYNYYLTANTIALAPTGSFEGSLSKIDLVGDVDLEFLLNNMPLQ